MNAIEKLGQDKTIILIAHRLSTLKNCDKIFIMEKGEIKKEISYEELNETGLNFQQYFNEKPKSQFINKNKILIKWWFYKKDIISI